MAVNTTRSALLRQLNERRILDAIRLRQPISRASLGREIRLTMPTVMRIVDSLLEQEMLQEVGSDESTGGRPATLLQLRADTHGAIGIELGRVYTRFIAVNMLCEVVCEEQVETAMFTDVNHLVGFVTGFLAHARLSLNNVLGIGIAAPGPLDPANGQWLVVEDIPEHWRGTKLVERFEQQLGLPAYLANDADAAALGETWFGIGKDRHHLLFVLADAGIGAGLTIHSSIYGGATNQAGEFSHTIVDMNGDVCACGRRGCVNTAAASRSIMRAVAERRRLAPDENVESIIQKAFAGPGPDRDVIERALRYLSVGIYNFIRVFNPDIVILGGRTLLSSNRMVERVQELTRNLCADVKIEIVPSQFGINAVAVGAASLVLQRVYDPTQLITAD